MGRAGTPAPEVIGIDEVSIRKGHIYRIVVGDLIRRRPIWFGGVDRSEASMDAFYIWLGPRKTAGIRLVVIDMWKAFRTSTTTHAPQASILFDKFHVLRHYLLSVTSILYGWVLAWSGRFADALNALERGVTLQERMQTKLFLPLMLTASAEAFLLSGRLPEARRAADRALELARESGERCSRPGTAWSSKSSPTTVITASGSTLDHDVAVSAIDPPRLAGYHTPGPGAPTWAIVRPGGAQWTFARSSTRSSARCSASPRTGPRCSMPRAA